MCMWARLANQETIDGRNVSFQRNGLTEGLAMQRSRSFRFACLACLGVIGGGGCSSDIDEANSDSATDLKTEALTTSALPTEPFTLEDGFALLTLKDFDIYHGKEPGQEKTWTSAGNIIKCSGSPRGYAYTKRSYDNFTLRLDYRFHPVGARKDESKDGGNTGVLVYITGENKLWPKCLEIQGKHVQMATIKSNSREITIEIDDSEENRQKARRPVGEWNSVEIVSKDGALTSLLEWHESLRKPTQRTKRRAHRNSSGGFRG